VETSCINPLKTEVLFDIFDVFVNCNWVVTRWQQYSTHLHTNSTQKKTIEQHKKQYIEQHKKQYIEKIHRTTQKIHRTTQKQHIEQHKNNT
jgi:hypothetical protein